MKTVLQTILQRELSDRHRRNASFGVRAFAKFLGLSPSGLSRLINGQRKASERVTQQIVDRLDLSEADRKWVTIDKVPIDVMQKLSENEIERLYEDWCGFAILEMIALRDFEPSPTWISSRLGISVHRVEAMIHTLQVLGALSVKADGTWSDTFGDSSFLAKSASSITRRRLLSQRLDLAREAVDSFPMTERDHSFITFACSREALPQAREAIQKCRRELLKLGASCAQKDTVYHADFAMFPITNNSAQKDNHHAS